MFDLGDFITLIFYCVVGGLAIYLVLQMLEHGEQMDRLNAECQETCDFILSKRIDGVCHCKTLTGWERASGD